MKEASSSKWAKLNPDRQREQWRRATKKFRLTEKGKEAIRRYSLSKRKGKASRDQVECIVCGRVDSRLVTHAEGWLMAKKWGPCKGRCEACA
jgi:DNA-binding PadR family transcriptional regulator